MFTSQFKYEKETKNKYVYQEEGSGNIGTLYVSKFALPNKPEKIKVTVEEVK